MSASGPLEFRSVGSVSYAIGSPSQLGAVLRETSPATERDIRSQLQGVLAALPGPMFEFGDDVPGADRTYERYAHGETRFAIFYPTRGVDDRGREPGKGLAIYVAGGRAGAERGAGSRKAGETFRVQTYPSLVIDGALTTGLLDVDSNNRPALGYLSDGRAFLALGRRVSMPQLAQALHDVDLGVAGAPVRVVSAGHLDGGGSAAQWVDVNGDGVPEASFNEGGRRIISLVTLEAKTPLEIAKANVLAALSSTFTLVLAGALVLALAGGAIYFGRNHDP